MSVKLELRDYQLEGVENLKLWWEPELEALIALTHGHGKDDHRRCLHSEVPRQAEA